jgi:glycosyltransferase involved in cell wall biosynthesis
LKVLISAYACEPGRSSEPGVGWNVIRELSARHQLWVLTRANNEPAIRAAGEPWTDQVNWLFLDLPPAISRLKKGASGLRPYYFLWQRLAFSRARELLKTQPIDLIHHLTFGHFLPPSQLSKLSLPFVCGPLGGGEFIPAALFADSSTRSKWLEWSRESLHHLATLTPGIRSGYRHAAACLAATPQTAEKVRALGAKTILIQHQSGISTSELTHLATLAAAAPHPTGPLKLVAASRLVHWKGIDLAIDAVALARSQGLDVQLEILQNGSEKQRLAAQVHRLGLENHITFRGHLPTLDDVYRTIASADALIHPAFHEAFGQACLESLALGVPVICLDWAGPAAVIDDSCGHKVPTGPRPAIVAGLATAMHATQANRPRRAEIAEIAQRRAAEHFHWRSVVHGIEGAWSRARPAHSEKAV